MNDKEGKYILWLSDITNDDVKYVGGKNASLGEMWNALTPQGIRIPNALVMTASGYRYFVSHTGLQEKIAAALAGLDTKNLKALAKCGKTIRELILKTPFPADLEQQILEGYHKLSADSGEKFTDVAVRSSATAEDLPGASFAGEMETYLNISGDKNVMIAVRKAMASLYTDRAISYRADKGFDNMAIALSVGIQKMVRSDKGASGVMFTLDTETGFRNVVEINSSYGLGEMIVQGKVTPDEFIVFKPTLEKGYPAIIKKSLGGKMVKMIYTTSGSKPVKEVSVEYADRKRFSLTDAEILELAKWGMAIEKHYTERSGHPMPMDIEWAKDGVKNELYIVQARPETVQAEKKGFIMEEYTLKESKPHVAQGVSVGKKIVTGKARVILSTAKLGEFKEGEILVTKITDPDWEPIMKIAKGIVTEKGGRTSHAAIVSRELGIPAVVGAEGVLSKVKTGDIITVDASLGDIGRIYKGEIAFDVKTFDLGNIPEVKTKICLNVGSPEGAFGHSFLPHKGVGLAREEFIIISHIQVHPMALIHFKEIKDAKLKAKIEKITEGYPDKKEFYIEKLAEGIAQIGAAFHPYQVIVRFSDFKTNEYRQLLGGEAYEPEEENPMIGWRGASRYAHPNFAEAFELECIAIKRVREQFGLENVQTMIPFCRTPKEGQSVVDIMKTFGLVQGEKDLKIYVMCEIPTNVLRADDFLDVFDGFSIGSNDLGQCTLGMDRDNAVIAAISNENDPSVKRLITMAIEACHRRGKYIGFCGQAPSDYPDFLRFLISQNIDSVSLNSDSVVPMTFEVKKEEDLQGR
ncbi:MAG: phosphoenolpyruvate synthase [Candidatus Paceibacterota bacterium]|jgi:pyruvate,water dikinase|nr:phosphoenolpyruvate synthase [Candidatus Paceibacterota bacterium]